MGGSYFCIGVLIGTLAIARVLSWRHKEAEDCDAPWCDEYDFVCYKEKEQ
jgi:hypothetical protein